MAVNLALGIGLATSLSQAIFFPFHRECRWRWPRSEGFHWWQLCHGEVKSSRLVRAAALLPLDRLLPSFSFALWCQQLPADFLAYQASFFLLANSNDPLCRAQLQRRGLSSLFPDYFAFPLYPRVLQTLSGPEAAIEELWGLLNQPQGQYRYLSDRVEWVALRQVARISPHFWVYSSGRDHHLGVCFLDEERRLSCWTAGRADQLPNAVAQVDRHLRFYQHPSLPPVNYFIPLYNRTRESAFDRFYCHEIPYPPACSVVLELDRVKLVFHHHPGPERIQDALVGVLRDLSRTRRLRPRRGTIELFFWPTTAHHQWFRVEGKRDYWSVWVPWNYWPLDWWAFWPPRLSLSRLYDYALYELDPEVPLSVFLHLLHKLITLMPTAS